MTDDDICGATDTTTGEPCSRDPGWGRDVDSGPCIDHTDDDTVGTGQRTELEENTSIMDLVAGELQNGATIAEACAGAGISERQYYDWRDRGRADEAADVFREFRKETGRARKIDSKAKRERLWDEAIEQGDIKTAYKLYHDQHGDTFDDDATGDADEAGIPLVVPDSARPES